MTASARTVVVLIVSALLIATPAVAQSPVAPPSGRDLASTSIEDLMNLEVTSVARKEQRVVDTASAVTVISPEDIRRSGATTVAELLRLVPGMQVARIDANKWAISSRGFNGRFADKMLVLVDGRTNYTPLFSGVYWDLQDLMLEDIQRIEVVRGPGAALWGANAVNGVINVITKSSRETLGGLASATGGTAEGGIGSFRYGGSAGSDISYRIYGRYFTRRGFLDEAGHRSADGWDAGRGGFRLDWERNADAVMVQAEMYSGSSGQTLTSTGPMPFYLQPEPDRSDVSGGFALTRWTRGLRPGSNLALQIYFDRHVRRDSVLHQDINIIDADFQHHFQVGRRHDAIWGASTRLTWDRIVEGRNVGFTPADEAVGLFSAFVQDEMVVLRDRLRLTLGTKLEHNAYTGWELQPNARVLVKPGPRQTAWAAISRAVRSPSRADTGVRLDTALFPSDIPGVFVNASIRGNPDFVSETVRAQEIGYRVQPHARTSLDVAAFYNVYDDLRTFEFGPQSFAQFVPVVVVFQPLAFDNMMHGDSRGIEVAANWDVRQNWRLTTLYSYIDVSLKHRPGSTDTIGVSVNDDSPRHQAGLQSRVDLSRKWELDVRLAYTGRLEKHAIPAYTRLDLRTAWKPSSRVELALVGQNLLTDGHFEFGSTLGELPTRTDRGIVGSLRWMF